MKFCGSIVCPRNFLSQNSNDANFAYSYAYNNVNFIRNSFYVTSLYVRKPGSKVPEAQI